MAVHQVHTQPDNPPTVHTHLSDVGDRETILWALRLIWRVGFGWVRFPRGGQYCDLTDQPVASG